VKTCPLVLRSALRIAQLFVILTAVALGVTPAFAVDPVTVFELEGNAVDSPTPPPDDWQNVNAVSPTGSSIARTGVLPDPEGTTIFTGGGSKDINDIDEWQHKRGSVPPKDEITNAYAATYRSGGGNLIIVAGADRFANNGDANVGFWFFQQNVAPQPDGTFGPGVHSVGDILVVVEFSGGGVVATAKVFEWVGAGGSDGALDLIQESAACSSQQNVDVCAQSNAGPVQLFWSYTPSQPIGVNVAPPGSFIEMGIDVSALSPGQSPCFTSFLVETRSSSELNAQLMDFVAAQRQLGKLKVPGQRHWQARRRGTHTLKVNNGRGSGRHVAGEMVKVTANTPPRGKKFAGWSGDIQILANPLLSTTTATMPSIDVRVRATYADVSQ
jgi:hypothetical protein